MKLYTEEQLKESLMKHQDSSMFLSVDQIDYLISEITPIELPTDEEINNEWEVGCSDYQNGCNYGAKWMRDKIKGGDNEQPVTDSNDLSSPKISDN